MCAQKGDNVQKAMFYSNAKVTKCKHQKQSKKNKINKTKDAVGAFPIKNKKKVIYIKPATNKELYERRIVKRFRESHLISKFSSWKIMQPKKQGHVSIIQ